MGLESLTRLLPNTRNERKRKMRKGGREQEFDREGKWRKRRKGKSL